MEMETKQLYVFIVLITLALKINASPLTENGTEDGLNPPSLNTSLGGGLGSHCENTLNEMPNIERAFTGFDIAKKSQFPQEYINDQFFRPLPIFDGVKEDDQSTTLDFVYVTNNVNCDTTFQQHSWESLEDYLYSSSRGSIASVSFGYTAPEVTAGISDPSGTFSIEATPVPNSVKVGGGNEESSSKMERFFENEGGSISRSKIGCSIYEVAIDIRESSLKFHPGFEGAIKRIDKLITDGADVAAEMKDFIDSYGTHYAKHAVMGVGSEFETRYTREETLENDRETRKKCNSLSGGGSLFGFSMGASATLCEGSLEDTTIGESSGVQRFTSSSYGIVPVDADAQNSLAQWSDIALQMYEGGTITPLPVQQELEPIYKLLLTEAVKAIKNDNDILIDAKAVYETVVKHYSQYCTVMGNCDFRNCPSIVRLDGNLYHETNENKHGRKTYKDSVNNNLLEYREGPYTNEWVVETDTDQKSISKRTAPCPQEFGEFKSAILVGGQKENIPNWKTCSSKCFRAPECKFWQYNVVDQVCKLIIDYSSIESASKSDTEHYLIGSKDCPGAAEVSESSYGQCPNNVKSKAMWKHDNNKFFDKNSRIEAYDSTTLVITGVWNPGNCENNADAWCSFIGSCPTHHSKTQDICRKTCNSCSGTSLFNEPQGQDCTIPYLPNTYEGASLVLTPTGDKLLHCGGYSSKDQYDNLYHKCYELDVTNEKWIWHSYTRSKTHKGNSLTMPNGVYLFANYFGHINFLPKNSKLWQGKPKIPTRFEDGCVVAISPTEILLIGGKRTENRILKLDTTTGGFRTWDTLNIGRHGHSCVLINKKVLVVGGQLATYDDYYNDPQLDNTEIIPIPNGEPGAHRFAELKTPRAKFGLVAIGGHYKKVLAFGRGDTEEWDDDNEVWKPFPKTFENFHHQSYLVVPPQVVCRSTKDSVTVCETSCSEGSEGSPPQGYCNEYGTCTCIDGFAGTDCSIDLNGCSDYEILDDPKRNRDYNGEYASPSCDKYAVEGDWKGGNLWYRFTGQAGTQLADSPTGFSSVGSTGNCGTTAQGWLNGAHPVTLGENVIRQVCFHYNGNSCHTNTDVEIKQCGGFYVYKLPKVPGCNMKYCGQ